MAAATLVVLVSIFHSSVLQIAVIVLLIASMLAIVGVIELLFERRSEAKEIARVG